MGRGGEGGWEKRKRERKKGREGDERDKDKEEEEGRKERKKKMRCPCMLRQVLAPVGWAPLSRHQMTFSCDLPAVIFAA